VVDKLKTSQDLFRPIPTSFTSLLSSLLKPSPFPLTSEIVLAWSRCLLKITNIHTVLPSPAPHALSFLTHLADRLCVVPLALREVPALLRLDQQERRRLQAERVIRVSKLIQVILRYDEIRECKFVEVMVFKKIYRIKSG
jgi:hypothetical protein